ncbi:MAG TPA: winged helix-turn-helix domain-containing protein [Bryobacteraceae bacterium]|nr:winged helix-turn-helix domain-containing protein [Bryobacteraceae bacterium]
MKNQLLPPHSVTFGPFELNTSTCEVRKRGVRVRLSGQPLQILVTLLAHAGEVVTREQLREEVWSETTFVDFEHGLNAAINKLRRALGDSAENSRFIETVPGRGYRFIGPLSHPPVADSPAVAMPVAAPTERDPNRSKVLWWLALIPVLLVGFWLLWSRSSSNTSAMLPAWNITRLTADAGLSNNPVLSPDGKLVAYSSDRENAGKADIYVQQVAGGQPIRLTFDGEGNRTPDFSPDGSKIAFRSNRNGGGVYEIGAFGGAARLLASGGLDPRYSPDGLHVAYWIGTWNIAQAVPENGTIWVVPVAGGRPRRIGTSFTSAREPIWSPDGKHLLSIGYASKTAYDGSALDWWLIAVDGQSASRTGAHKALAAAGLHRRDFAGNRSRTIPIPSLPRPKCWLEADNTIIFSAENGDTYNLWSAGISPAGTLNGKFRRLTAGAGNEVEPSCASNGALAFTSLEKHSQLSLLPFDLNRGTTTGPLQRVVGGPSTREYPSLSSDGRRAAFASAQSGRLSIWIRDLTDGTEARVATSPFVQRYPEMSKSGAKVAFSSYERDKRLVYVAAGKGPPELMCEGCLRATDWSKDDKTILVFGGEPYRINTLDVASRQQAPLIAHPSNHVLYGRFSPDNRWISFTVRIAANRAWIAIAPVAARTPVPEPAWIKISEEGPEDRANWSPDGNTLYFTSERDGYTCLWGQRLDTSRRPIGQPFGAHHFHERLVFQKLGWSVGAGRLAMALGESTGNIWMMSSSGAR